MSKEPTDKCYYLSQYSPGEYITAAQYILELICEKKAEFEKTNLPIKFWNLPKWNNFYKKNLRQVYKLLKEFDELAIIYAIKSKEFTNRYSIFTDTFLNIVSKNQIQLVNLKPTKVELTRDNLNTKPRPHQVKTTILDKLDDQPN